MKKILFLAVALASMLACLFYAFDGSFFQNNGVEEKEIKEPKHQLIYDADYDFSEPLVVIFSDGELKGKNEISEYRTVCRLINDTLLINMSEGFMTGFDIDLTLASDTVKSQGEVGSCTYFYDYEPIFSKVILGKRNPKIKDSIHISLDMVFVCYDTLENFRDTMRVRGSQKIQVREKSYSQHQKMKELYMKRFIAESKQRPDTITHLNFSYMELDSLPNELFLFKNLKELNISNSKISVKELNTLTQLNKLEKLYIEDSNLEEFPSKLVELEHLKELKLFRNNISKLPNNFFKLKKLESLQMESNSIINFPKVLYKMPNLRILYLRGNEIKHLESELNKLKQLEEHDYTSETYLY
ncbi:leucine-rich repeat domain-containing protein [Bernardetia sp.]|uniref:leucine-rich repeat domain-containing protein n=1 Tax=Bernardetia sp. TaxID=1937974 RepID=UPI0025BD0C50|nr:leucine-rich repeat domain-containing protein [Bernardetia sp.]